MFTVFQIEAKFRTLSLLRNKSSAIIPQR